MVVLTVTVFQSNRSKGLEHVLIQFPNQQSVTTLLCSWNALQQYMALISLFGVTDLFLHYVICFSLISDNN